jgi:tetratricopeptide (TPR) repeat protein
VNKPRIVFTTEDGSEIPPEELTTVDGRFHYQLVSDTEVSEEAQDLHEKGRIAGQEEEFDRALGLFAQARELAPDWPFPVYDAAFTHLLMKDYKAAAELYEAVDRMAPWGFFTARTAADSLRREREGLVQTGAYLELVLLEAEAPSEEKFKALVELIRVSPSFPAAWSELAGALEAPEERMQALEQGLEHEPDSQMRETLLLSKAIVFSSQEKKSSAIEILKEMVGDPETTLSNLAVAQVVLVGLEKEA